MLYDNHGRPINYLRLAVTDRCNLRCFYCMPEEGINYVPRADLLSYEEMLRLCRVLCGMGINKIRITGGEPFLRKELPAFLMELTKTPGLDQLNITTNGTLTEALIPRFREMGISSVNLSIDSLDRERFKEITRRDALPQVMATYRALLEEGIPTKLNAVVMAGRNTVDILSMAEETKSKAVDVRFIEEMPFNGSGIGQMEKPWTYQDILAELRQHYPKLSPLTRAATSTSQLYQVPGYMGRIGIIAAYSRTFCGTCNRIRLTPKGMLKTCLYDNGVMDVRGILRNGATDEQLKAAFLSAIGKRAKDGFEAEAGRSNISESMATIGG